MRFVGAQSAEDDRFALTRLRNALAIGGFETVAFQLEPIAAALYYAARLDHEELILIGDFGGGTSDCSLLRAGPQSTVNLGTAGVGLAGDAFDAKIVLPLGVSISGCGGLFSLGRQGAANTVLGL